ncbi:ABC transporter permease [Patescibacteria group bacterium]
MNHWLTIKLAITGLLANKMRAFLTILGTIIGVSAIIVIVSVGNGAESLIVSQVESIGSNLVGILPGGSDEDEPPAALMGIVITTLKYEDIAALRDIPNVVEVAGYNKEVGEVVYKNNKTETTLTGTFSSYPVVEEADLSEGRFFNETEERGIAKVIVLGSQIKKDLFGSRSPIGESVKIQSVSFKVIGVMEERGASGFSNNDTLVFIPVKTMHKLILGVNHLALARVKVNDDQNVEEVMATVENILRGRHSIDDPKDDDFTVASQAQSLDTVQNITGSIKIMLTAIAFIALIVGGIGIMNVMYIAVTERTREIGLRKALGAKRKDILSQFLVEAVSITSIGGAIGIIIGVLFSALVAATIQYLGYDWAFIVTGDSIIIASLVIAGVGIVFGYGPAKKAAGLPAIEALRYE